MPHTYSRTRALLDQYGSAFRQADYVIIPDIEPARERHLKKLIHARDLVREIEKVNQTVRYIPHRDAVIDYIKNNARSGDVVLCMSVRGFDDLARNLAIGLKQV